MDKIAKLQKTHLHVEGNDEFHFLGHLLPQIANFSDEEAKRYKDLKKDIFLHKGGGVSEILQKLGRYLKTTDTTVEAIGFIFDADDEGEARWESVRSTLLAKKFLEVPETLNRHGIILTAPDNIVMKRVGIWMMPDNINQGELEDFVQALIPQNDLLWPLAIEAVDHLPTPRRFKKEIKAQIHTWLAWQEEPGTPLGQAITKKYLDLNQPVGKQFAEWLQALFLFESP